MSKKSTTARSGAQRNKPKVQKSFELVHQDSEHRGLEKVSPTPRIKTESVGTQVEQKENKSTEVAKTSASVRLAARRHTTQRPQQRSSATLINAEHFGYVRRDLLIIAALACLMFVIIIVSYFVLAKGA